MQGGVTKKKEDKKKDVPLRNVLGSYDPMTVSLPIDQSLSMIGAGQPINLSTMLTPQTPIIKKDKLAQINLGNANTVADIKPKKTDEKVVKYLKSKGKIKPKEEAPPPTEDPSWFERNKKGLRDAGIILAGGLQSFGEGIKGGNQSAANEQIYENLDAAAKSDEMELLEDPNSEQSKQARSLFTQQYGNRVKMPENMNAAQYSKLSPVFDKILQRKLMEMKANAPKSPKANPNMKEMSQVNTYRENLNRNLDKLSKLTQKYGTFELTGSAEQERQQLINDIAIAKMKMQDPTSIVSSKEADQVADALGVQGFFKSNDAALNSIKAFRDEVNSAADTKLRGLVGMEEDQEALQWAQQNPYDPDAQKILSMYGVK